MDLQKSLSHWEADSQHVRIGVPISKVDVENRLVSGFATLDNIDSADDVVLAEASASAFERFRGNIREMHQPIAAGRMVDFKQDSFYDSRENKFYSGIYVTAYVSKGAEDTWQKVLDGTLTGFSIGGNITEQETEFVKDAGRPIRFIKGYDLYELSLVDNPCNMHANILSVVKSAEGTFIKGMIADTEVVNVFWCSDDEIAKNSTSESEICLNCGSSMELIGWFEKGDDLALKVADTVAKFLRHKEEDAVTKQADAHGEGGVEMADEKDKNVVTSGDVTGENVVEGNVEEQGNANAEAERAAEADGKVLTEDEVQEVTSEDEEDKAADVEEVDGDPDFEKMFEDFKGAVKESIEKTVERVETRVEEVSKAFDEKASEFEKSLGELSNSLAEIKSTREDVAKRLDALERATAFKKSGEVEGGQEPVAKSKKGLWSGTFLSADD